ncbi:MAG: hypothetical protein WCA77_01415 [Thermoplasmata archaeon]
MGGSTLVSEIVEGPLTLVESMERDEELLRAGRLAVRVARLANPALSLGAGQRDTEGLEDRARELGVPTHRRPSGGLGLLLLPGDILWSVMVPPTVVGPSPTRSYGRFGAGVIDFLEQYRVGAAWVDAWGLSPSYCLLGPRGQVLARHDKAFGGAAQHLTRSGLLHHGVLIARRREAMLGPLFGLTEELLASRLTSLDELGIPYDDARTPARLVRALGAALRRSVDR